ncbi:MAG TPA: PIN domain nuclease, partial [Anaerolineaceae bacterium]|nr:PIN domain nuclease [Anaerolineaceae bacterium]
MSTDFIFRLLGMVVFTVLGMVLGQQLGQAANVNPVPGTLNIEQYTFTIGLVGALTGLVLTPYFTTRPARFLRDLFKRVSAQTLFSALVGAICGLLLAALLAYPLSLLPKPFGNILPFLMVVLLGYTGITLFVMRQDDLLNIFSSFRGTSGSGKESALASRSERTILLDTSVIIDGRIA